MKRICALLCLLAMLLMAGCTGLGAQKTGAFAPDDKNRLVICTSHKKEVYEPIIREFEQRTGIWVELETGGTTALLSRIAAGEISCDLMLGGGIDSLQAYSDCFSEYVSPNAEGVLPAYRSADGSYSPFSALPIVLIYNTKLVRVNPPTGWESLIDEAWKGKIAFADPEVSGSSYTSLCTMIQAIGGDSGELLKAFSDNLDGRLLADSGDVVSAVADGRCYIGVTLEETALKAIASGYDMAIVYPSEGTSALPDGAAVIDGCEHRENAEMFIDFLLCQDMQEFLQDKLYRRSVCKTDMPAMAELELIDYDLEWASGTREELMSRWDELMGGARA